jgi:hypothetical protein
MLTEMQVKNAKAKERDYKLAALSRWQSGKILQHDGTPIRRTLREAESSRRRTDSTGRGNGAS